MFSSRQLLPCVATAFALSTSTYAAVIAVDFTGDITSTNRNSNLDENGSIVVQDTGDFAGDSATDARSTIPLDHPGNFLTFTPVTPGKSNLFSTGVQVIDHSVSTDRSIVGGFLGTYRMASSDNIQASTGTTQAGATAVDFTFIPHVRKANFLNGASVGQTVSFADDPNGFFVDWAWTNSGGARRVSAVVQDGSDWYVAETLSATNDGDRTFNPATELWYPFASGDDLFFDFSGGGAGTPTGTGVLGSTFTDIQAVGSVHQITDFTPQSALANLQNLTVSLDFTTPPPPPRPIGSPIVQWNMDTVTPNDTTTDQFSNVWTSDAVPDSSGTSNPGLIAGNTIDPLLLGNATDPNGQFPVSTRPTITSGGMGVSGEALSFDGVDDQAFGITAWLADTSETLFIPGLEGVYVSLDFNEVSNTDGTQVLASARGTWELRIDADGNLEWYTRVSDPGGNFDDVIEAALDAPGDWHNVEAWHGADGVKALAIDGVVVAQSAPGILLEDRDSIVLGNRENQSLFFEGLIDNVYVGSGIIPEPASIVMVGVGGMLAAARRRRA